MYHQFTRSISNSKTGNCHGCAYNGLQGREAEGFLNGGTRDEYLLSQYEPVSDIEHIPEKFIGRFGGELSIPDVHDIENIIFILLFNMVKVNMELNLCIKNRGWE